MRSHRSHWTKDGKPRLLRNARLAVETLEARLVLDSGPLVISEFMANNAHGLQDKDGAYSDWIEVYNPTQGAVNLEGWSLTDDADTLTKWQFPNTDLPGGGYLVVFASGKNVTTGLELHTNFNLDKAGEYLALVKPDGQTVSSSFAPEYPQQATDVSYGWSQDLATKGFFATPSPGKPNLEIPLPNSSQQIVVNEIMYHPGYGEAGSIDYVPENTAEEYVELYNRTSSPVSLKGWQLDKWWFALDPMKRITGISFSGTTATAALPGHGYSNGDSVQILGAAQSQYNGVFTISNVTASTFDYTMSSAPTQAASGAITAQKGVRTVASVTREEWTATVHLPAHGFVTGDSVLISGADQDPYNGVFTVTVLSPDTFTYTLGDLPVTPATGTILAQKSSQTLPDVTIPGQGYLVVAGDGKAFRQKYPAVANVIAAWTPKLSDSGEKITLRNADGDKIDEVNYANQGDWAQRTRGEQKVTNISRNGTTVTVTVPYHGYTLNYRTEDRVYRIAGADQTEFNGEWTATAMTRDTITFTIAGSSTSATGNILIQKKDAGHYGWEWYTGADGHGKSLELTSAKMTNNNGQNWGASTVEGGTPGAANSIAAADIAPLVSDVTHFPVIPSHTSTVTVTARISDELATGVTASVYYRVDGATSFTTVAMADDGLHGDSAAGDGLYGATLPAQPNNTVVEYYVRVSDAGSHVRTWPAAPGLGGVAPAAIYSGQTANLLYQVDDTYTPTWTPGSQPIYRLIMKATDRDELLNMGSLGDPDMWSDRAMNGVFVTVDGSGIDLKYQVGIRNRGHGTRDNMYGGHANNYKVEIPHDHSWKGYENTIINYNNSPAQVLGAVMSQASGIAMPNEQPIQVRVNGVNYALGSVGGGTDTHMYGTYAGKEQYDAQFTARAFSDDPDGNLYVVHYTDYPLQRDVDDGNLRYEGASANAYRDTYRKQTNVVQDDWSDLIRLTYVLNDTNISDANFLQEVGKVIDVNQWLRYIAFDTLMGNREGGLCTGIGDDYGMYRGIKDPRFKLVFWDTDTLTVWGGSTTANIFSGYTSIPGLNRLLTNQATVGMYYAQLKDLMNTVFAAQNFNPMVDQIFAGWLPQAKINDVKTFMASRITNVLGQIPTTAFTVTSPLTVVNGYPHTTTTTTALNGTADQVQTRSVMVNGQPATWNSSTGAWSAGTSTGGTGGSDFLVNTGDDWKYFAASGFNVTAYQATIPVTSVAVAETVISNPGNRSNSWTQTTPTVNYINTGGSGTAVTFQEGVGSYAGTQDTYIGQDTATTDHSSATLAVDTQVGSGGPAQSLLRFDNLFGNGAGQIPAGAVVSSAILTINVSDASVNGLKLYRMAQTWTEAATWQAVFGGNGIQADGVEALATSDAALAAPTATGKYTIDVTTSLRAWLADPTKNFGWVLLADGSDGIQISCSENATAGNRPLLTVTLNSQPTAGGHFGSDNAFPGQAGAVDNFVIEASYRVFIPTPGQWTFGVTSDDGFKLTLDNGVDPAYTATFDGTRTVADTLQTFNIAHAGTYNLRLVYFENTANAGVELYAASGLETTFNTTDFHLLGDVAHGGLGDSDQGNGWYGMTYDELGWSHGPSELGYNDNTEATPVTFVDADPTTTAVEKNFTTYFRRTFQVVDTSQYTGLVLHLLYDDGAIVYLNGNELFRTANMPTGTVTSMMGATGDTPSETAYYDFPIALSKLQVGTNVLAVEIHQYGAAGTFGSGSSDISMDARLEATKPGGTGSGLPLTPGINRFTVQTFDGPNGTGNKLQEGTIDVWCDPGTTPTSLPAPADPPGLAANPHINLQVRDSYLPGVPITVRAEIADDLQRVDRDVWNATVTLSSSNANVQLSATQVTLYNGMGSVLVVPTVTGAGNHDFTLTATWNGKTATKAMTSLESATVTTVAAGTISSNATWSGVVHVTGNVTVASGATLTIQPGTLVMIDGVTSGTGGISMTVQGSVQSLGTAASPVTFTTPTYDAALGWGEIHHTAGTSRYQYTELLRSGRAGGQGHTNTGPTFLVDNSTLTFDHASISDNIGKVMQSNATSSLTFQHCLFARSVMGPEISGTSLLMQDTFIEDMHNPDDADGIYLHDQQAGQTITLRGGAVANVDDDCIDTLGSTVLIDDMVIRNSNDKAVSVLEGATTITRCLVVDTSRAPEDGSQAALSIKTREGGTGIMNVDRTTVYNDHPTGIGVQGNDKYGITSGHTIINVTNSIIVAYEPMEVDAPPYSLDEVRVSYSDLVGTAGLPWTTGGSHDNLMVDPQFVSLAGRDYRLQATSPCINTGSPTAPPDVDGTRADMGYSATGLYGVYAPQTIAAGHITQNTVLYSAGGPYHVTGDVIVDPGATLTVAPGTTIFFDAGTGMTVNGRLVAEGTAEQMICFTRTPGSGTWDGLLIRDTMEDNRITYSIVEYGEGQFPGATDRYLIAADASKLLLDHDVLDHAQYRRIRTTNSSLIVRNTTFTDIFGPSEAPITNNGSEQIWGNNASAGGQVLIENNVFGTTKGHNDVMDVDGGIKANGDPVIVVRNNIFMGGGDEAMDLEGDFLIEGNLIMHFKKDSYAEQQDPAGQCNSISAGDAHLVGHHYEVVNNVFYDVDHVVLAKDKTTLTFVNNTVINVTATKPAIYFEIIGDSAGAGTSAEVDASIFQNVPIMFDFTVHSGAPTPQLTVNRSIVPAAWFSYGTGNIDADPRIANPAGGDFSLLPGSPALGTGLSGHDMGGLVPAGAWVTGEPAAITSQTGATLAVSGLAITHYKYRLNSGAWSAETPVTTPVQLSNLTDGTYTVYVVGKNLANLWQDVSAATASATWTVNTSRTHLRINEVLASNTSVNHQGAVTDLVELYNDGATTVDLAGMSISDDAGKPDRFVFPAGTTLAAGQYLVLSADSATTAGLHLGFGLDADGGGVYLFDTADSGGTLLDSVTYGPQVANYSIGRAGHDGTWTLTQPTFGTANAAARTGNQATVKLNEWLAVGQVSLADDFVELYNPDSLPAPLAGLYLTDNTVTYPARHQIAPLSYAPAGGCASFIADGNADHGANHLGFKLDSSNEWIGLYDAELKLMDRILHFDQTTDVSQGRTPDGGASPYQYFTIPTPSLTNAAVPANITNLANGLRITKVMYNPAGDGDYEFIELKNTSADKTLDLTGVRLGGGVSFTFPLTTPATTLTPGQTVLLVRNQTKFTARYGTGVNVAGEYVGKLADGGDSIVLQLPAPFDSAILRFDYKDGWYEGTDGGGYALTIKDTTAAPALWDDSSNWMPGTALETLIWNKTGDGNWTEARWTGSSPPSPDSTSNAVVSAPHTVTVDSAQAANSLAVNDSGQVTIAATGSLAVGKDLQIAGGGRMEILAGGSLTAGGTVVVNGGAMTLPTGPSAATVGGLSVQGGANISGGTLTAGVLDLRSGTVTTNLVGSGAATKTTTGTVTLSGANTYTGGTTVSEGTLVVNSAGALPAGGSLTIGEGSALVLSSGLSVGTGQAAAGAAVAFSVAQSADAAPISAAPMVAAAVPLTVAVLEKPAAAVAPPQATVAACVQAQAVQPWPERPVVAAPGKVAPAAPVCTVALQARDALLQLCNVEKSSRALSWLWELQESARPARKDGLQQRSVDNALLRYW